MRYAWPVGGVDPSGEGVRTFGSGLPGRSWGQTVESLSPQVSQQLEVAEAATGAVFSGRIVPCPDVSLTRTVACPLIRLS
jgi:hypothetical protein